MGLSPNDWVDLEQFKEWERRFGEQGLNIVGVLREDWDFDPATKQAKKSSD